MAPGDLSRVRDGAASRSRHRRHCRMGPRPGLPVVQYRTTKHDNFHSARNRFFEGNRVPGSFSERLKMFKSGFARLFPRFLGLNDF